MAVSAEQDVRHLTIALAKALVAKAYETKQSAGCGPADTNAPAAEQADLDLIATINDVAPAASLATHLRTIGRQIGTAITGGRNRDACLKVAPAEQRLRCECERSPGGRRSAG